jgi:hypothetical protein
MSGDFNPGKYEQPDFAKDEVNSARTGLGIVLLACFTFGQSIAAFSRIPGSAGGFFAMAQLLCIVAQAFCYEAFAESSGEPDAIGITLPLLLQFVWFVVVVMATIRWRSRGFEAVTSQPGVGILHKWMAGHDLVRINLASDLVVGVPLVIVCFLAQSPILGRWYLAAVFALVFTHLWMDWMQRSELQRMKYAKRRAEQWSAASKRSQWR